MTLLLLWYCLGWTIIGSYCRQGNEPTIGLVFVIMLLAPLIVAGLVEPQVRGGRRRTRLLAERQEP